MFTLGILVVGDLDALVNVVCTERYLFAEEGICNVAGVHGGEVQLAPVLLDVRLSEQCEGLDVLVVVHAELFGVLLKCEEVCVACKGLMVGIKSGVDDGDPAACAGVAVCPGCGGAGHDGGGRHIGICRTGGAYAGFIGLLDNDIFNAVESLDLLDGSVGYVCGDDVRRKSQIPNDVKILSSQNLFGNGLCHGVLLRLKSAAVAHGACVGSYFNGGEARCDGTLLFQNYGDTNDVRIRIFRSVGVCIISGLGRQIGFNRVIVHLLPCYSAAALVVGRHDGKRQAHKQHDDKQQ